MESLSEQNKSRFPVFKVPLNLLGKDEKDIIFAWAKTRIATLSSEQCSQLMARCKELTLRPATGTEHKAEFDGKWKLNAVILPGKVTFTPGIDPSDENLFKFLIRSIAGLTPDLLIRLTKDVVDFLPKGKPEPGS